MLRLLTPHLQVERVEQLGIEQLRQLGVRHLLLDVDCTLKRYRQPDVSPEVAAWLAGLQAEGIGMCLASNGLGRRIDRLAAKLGLPHVAKAMKPLPFRIKAAMRRLDFDPQKTAIVGDQLFADVLAGRLAGLISILVRPMHPEDEPWFTRMKRRPERFLLRRAETPEDSSGDGSESAQPPFHPQEV
jgi:HAD superfamily phosphatase (TIGR01668 family)